MMSAKFVAIDGPLKGLELPLLDSEDSWIMGRDPEFCQLLIEDPSVSRQHVLIKKSDDGMVAENLSKTNKTFLNNEEITAPQIIHNSDFLKIGSGSYRFEVENMDSEQANENPKDEQQPLDAENSRNLSEINDEPLSNNNTLETDMSLELDEEVKNDINQSADAHLNNSEDEVEDSIFQEEFPAGSEDIAEINFDYSETGRFLLKVISGVNNGAEFPMQENNSYLIGTDPSACDIIFNDNSVSRHHAKLSIDAENHITVEDLRSRNGTLVDGEPIKETKVIDQNALITIGTTSFVIYDRESAMQTVISPLMPSIVRILQAKEEAQRKEEEKREKEKVLNRENAELAAATIKETHKPNNNISAFLLTSIITGLFVIAGIATTMLFKTEPVVTEHNIDIDEVLSKALENFPSIKHNFNKSTGMLLLAGHVSTSTDKNQLLYNLQGLKFIKNIDDAGVVIDEFAWREINPTLSRNPAWRSVSIQSQAPGKFVLSGYLQTRRESEQLWDYVSNNFPYINLLEKKIVVEEDVISNVSSSLLHEGFKDVTVQMSDGELTLTGFVSSGKESILGTLVQDFRAIPGIRGVKNYVTEIAADQSMINLTDRYDVTGHSLQGKGNLSVVINGRILIRGDVLDGMLITSVKPNAIFLEKDGVKYRIDYNQ
jgi:type III secretion system YscD/HrpQ family protein